MTQDFLAERFEAVDMFDKDSDEIAKAMRLKLDHENIQNIECASMQKYKWKEKYNCIFIRWGLGYLKDKKLPSFLKKAKEHLDSSSGRATRQTKTNSYIIILDNLCDPGEEPLIRHG